MSEPHSTPADRPAKSPKPDKPYPDYPLFPHASGQWAKKIRGRLIYFGKWTNPDAALARYLEQRDDLHAGRTPRPEPGALTVKDVANAYLNHQQLKLDAGELVPRTWVECKSAADLIVGAFGKHRLVADLGTDDFSRLRARMAGRWGPARVGVFVSWVRSIFKYALDAGLIDRPIRFGPGFSRPTARTMRLHRARRGLRMFEADEIRRMLDAAGAQLRAMILLGVNAGFGNADVGTLPLSALDLESGWVRYPRPKTGVDRRVPLWPKTIQALREALARRPAPKDPGADGLVFVTSRGSSWAKDDTDNPLSMRIRRLRERLGIGGRRGFYALRHTFETVAGESRDQVAVDAIMGHSRGDMASVYRERISDARLRAVTEHVHAWLFGLPRGQAGDNPVA
jgi:integrase